MASVSKSLSQPTPSDAGSVSVDQGILWDKSARRTLWLQICSAYFLLQAALWTPPGPLEIVWIVLAMLTILGFAFSGRYSLREMGLARPSLRGTLWILGVGLAMTAAIPVIAALTHGNEAPTHALPFRTAWRYGLWAVEQQFILQSFFYVRLETLLGSRRAVWLATLLFASTHIPSPVLTVGTVLAGFFFCEMFRRFRTIFPLGVVHAAMGLTMAASFSDSLLHHMRVGLGYLHFP